jgi:Protein of unknown function (DUF2771)
MTRLRIAALGILAAGLLTACDAPQPEVTWYGNRTSVNSGPALYCTITDQLALRCPTLEGPGARLKLYPDDRVQVNVPHEIAAKPWWLVVSYADGSLSYRTPLFTDGKTLSYVIEPNGHPLKQIDLQVPTIIADSAGAPQYAPYQVWVLMVDPA